MADYSYDIGVSCKDNCGKTRVQDWADDSWYLCADCRKLRVMNDLMRIMGTNGESGTEAQFNAVSKILERLMVLEGKLPPR